jgi:hypothetical protein
MAETDPSMSDEMISAYLDGELSSDERQAVERALQQDAACQQLYDQLRALRESLQGLPRHELDAEFAARVLRRIGEIHPDHAPQPARASGPRGIRRGLAWAAVAIAAGVAVMLLAPPAGRDRQQVAHVPADKGEATSAPRGAQGADDATSAGRVDLARSRDHDATAAAPQPQSAGQRAVVGGIGGAAFSRGQEQRGDRDASRAGLRVDVSDQQLAELLARLSADGFAPMGGPVAGDKDSVFPPRVEPTVADRLADGTSAAVPDSEARVTRVRVTGSVDQLRSALERWGFRAEEVPAAEALRYFADDLDRSAAATAEKSSQAPAQAESLAVAPQPAAQSLREPPAGARSEADMEANPEAAGTELAQSREPARPASGICLFFRHIDAPTTAAPDQRD